MSEKQTITLMFADGRSIECLPSSTITFLQAEVESFALVDDIKNMFTEENLQGCTLDGNVYINIIPMELSAQYLKETLKVLVTMTTRIKSEQEIMKDEIGELQDAIIEILEGE